MDVLLPRPRRHRVLTSKAYLELKREALEALHEEGGPSRRGPGPAAISSRRTAGAPAVRAGHADGPVAHLSTFPAPA